MNKIAEYVNYKPKCTYHQDESKHFYYEIAFYCQTNHIIHPNLKSILKCNLCVNEQDKLIYEAQQRMNWFLKDHFIHNLNNSFSKLTTEEICKQYNVNIKYFKPWL